MSYDRDEFAPSGGWTSINQETLAPLKGSDTVLDLLRCIPYIDSPSTLAPFLMKDTPVTDYHSEDLQREIREDCVEGLVTPITGQDPSLPPSCAVVAICRGRNGYEVILDTADSYIYWGEPTGGHEEPAPVLNSTLERFRGDPANEWRLAGFNVYEPAGFFALCKKRYRELSWIGLGPSNMSAMRRNMNWEYKSETDSDSDPEDDFSHNKIARKMKKAGGPGDGEGRDWDRNKFERLLDQGNDAHLVWHD